MRATNFVSSSGAAELFQVTESAIQRPERLRIRKLALSDPTAA